MSDVDVPQASSEDPVLATLPPGPAPGPEDLLGLRIAAALIDLAVLAGISAILAAAVGQPRRVRRIHPLGPNPADSHHEPSDVVLCRPQACTSPMPWRLAPA